MLRLPAPPGPRRPTAGCLLPSLPPRRLGAPWGRGADGCPCPGGQRLECPFARGSLSLRLLPGARHPHPLPSFPGQRPECPLSISLRVQGILSSSSVSPRAAPCVISLLLLLRARVLLSAPRFPGADHCGNPPAPVPLGVGSPLSLPVLPGTPPPRGLCQAPSGCVFFFSLSPRVRWHLRGQISCLPSAPTTTETLPRPRHLVVATSSLLPFEGRWRLPLNSCLPPPSQRRKTLGHPPVAGRLHLGQRGRGKWGDCGGTNRRLGPSGCLTCLFLPLQGLREARIPVPR